MKYKMTRTAWEQIGREAGWDEIIDLEDASKNSVDKWKAIDTRTGNIIATYPDRPSRDMVSEYQDIPKLYIEIKEII